MSGASSQTAEITHLLARIVESSGRCAAMATV